MASGKVNSNVAQKIGSAYEDFGVCPLLEDNNGDYIDAIVRELHERAGDINRRIFRLWVKGGGQQSVSWATLVVVLQDRTH